MDLPEVLAVDRDGFDPAWGEDDFLARLRQRNIIGYIAEDTSGPPDHYGHHPVAGFFVIELHPRRVELLRLAVAPRYRRRGVGRAMLEKVRGKLSPGRRTTATLAVPDDNLAAHLWLRACGWAAVGVDGGDYLFRCEAAPVAAEAAAAWEGLV